MKKSTVTEQPVRWCISIQVDGSTFWQASKSSAAVLCAQGYLKPFVHTVKGMHMSVLWGIGRTGIVCRNKSSKSFDTTLSSVPPFSYRSGGGAPPPTGNRPPLRHRLRQRSGRSPGCGWWWRQRAGRWGSGGPRCCAPGPGPPLQAEHTKWVAALPGARGPLQPGPEARGCGAGRGAGGHHPRHHLPQQVCPPNVVWPGPSGRRVFFTRF